MATGGPGYMLEFPHGYTYSAHPVACAAGNVVLDILQKEDMPARVKALAPFFVAIVPNQPSGWPLWPFAWTSLVLAILTPLIIPPQRTMR